MINLYLKYIHPRCVKKDINYHFDVIKDLITNDIFSMYVASRRKNENVSTYIIEDHLSRVIKTKMQFLNDRIIINIIENEDKYNHPLVEFKNKLYFKNMNITNIEIEINLLLSQDEIKNKLIYSNNPTFIELRKKIKELRDFYDIEHRKRESYNYKTINESLKKLNKSYYADWNKLIQLLIDCTDPEYYNNVDKLKHIIKAFRSKTMDMKFKMVHNTNFYQKYHHYKQIKIDKFVNNLKKNCLDENEIITMTNNLSLCFGHNVYTIEDSLIFIKNIIEHFNKECNFKERQINLMIQ